MFVDTLANGDEFPLAKIQEMITEGMLDGLTRETLERLAAVVLLEVANDPSFSHAELVRAAELYNVVLACIADAYENVN